jgi:hypothetical protein
MHRYRRLVRRGIARPLLCPDCQLELTTATDEKDEPALVCHFDGIFFKPGSAMYASMRAVVSEHYVD